MDQAQLNTYHAEWHRWRVDHFISEENLKFHFDESYVAAWQAACLSLDVFLARVVVEDRKIGKVPATLRDWLVKYLLRAAPFLSRWLRVDTLDLVHHQEYRQCPHLVYEERAHHSWLMYGHPFDEHAEDKRRASHHVLTAAIRMFEAQGAEQHHTAESILMRAVVLYQKTLYGR